MVGDELSGGPGDDLLIARGRAQLGGGAGQDHLIGSSSGDSLLPDGDLPIEFGGPLRPAAEGSDIVEGGAGYDDVAYVGRAGMRIDLPGERAVVKETGVADTLTGIEQIFSGLGDDDVIGTADGNALDGGPGRDRIRGGAGTDWIKGGLASDVLDAGPGDDEINAFDEAVGP